MLVLADSYISSRVQLPKPPSMPWIVCPPHVAPTVSGSTKPPEAVAVAVAVAVALALAEFFGRATARVESSACAM